MVKIRWNKVIYLDCMDENKGLPSLSDKSIDLCLTDPPYDIKDISWIDEVLRICHGLIFSPGKQLYFDYIRYRKPNYQSKYWYKVNTQGTDLIEPFLCYGKIRNITKLRSVFEFPFRQGFKKRKYHPYPKNMDMWSYLLVKLEPISVLDLFIGSGTTAAACNKLGIKWLGYEINEIYAKEINERLKYTKREKQLKVIDKWLEN